MRNLHYYQVFAGWRFGIIMLRIAQQIVHYELATAEQGRELELNNTVTRLTAKLEGPARQAMRRWPKR